MSHSNVTASPELHDAGMHRPRLHAHVWPVQGEHAPLRQILWALQSVGREQDGEQVQLVPSERHTLVRFEAHVSCSDEQQAHASPSTTQAGRTRAPQGTVAMLAVNDVAE